MKNTGFLGGLYALTEWIMRLSLINLLWILFNIPVLFLALNILFVQQMQDLIIIIVPITMLIPILFFPATTAMFASARSWLIEVDDLPIIRTYWKFYKTNYKKSLLGGLIFTAIWGIWAVDIYYLSDVHVFLMYIFLAMGIILFVYTLNFFSLLCHYEMKLFPLLKNTLIVTLASPLLFLTIVLSSAFIIYISFEFFKFLIPFFTVSLIAFLSFSAFYRFYLKVQEKKEERKKEINK
ncbi:YesL family protein [Salipaludibacillus sp. HK11]|uniref:YesL family protein n=1 Tax=Salipaludibacillus sp. HK11 TaxID=3394320 RepID=UPI0039FD1C33